MRRFLGFVVLAAIIAIVAPAQGDTDANSCVTTQAATASPLIGDTAPVCTFEVQCVNLGGCLYAFTLDVNGTGVVSGTMSAEKVTGGSVQFESPGSPAPDPACEGVFQCHQATGAPNFVALRSDQGVAKVTCTGGGLAAVETVGCGLARV